MPLLCRMPWAPCNGTTSTPPKLVVMLAPNHSTLQWHPAMAPRPLEKLAVTLPPNHSTLQWHPAMAPSNGTTSTPPNSPPTIAHYDGTQQWHHVHSPKVGRHPPPNHTTLQWHSTMAPRAPRPLPTLQWQCAMAPNVHCTLQWHPGATSNQPKWFVALPPYWK